MDTLLEKVAEDMEHYSNVVLKDILDIKAVKATRSSFVLSEIKSIY